MREQIEDIVRQTNATVNFVYDRPGMINIKTDKVKQGQICVILYQNITSTIRPRVAGLRESQELMLEVLLRTEFENDAIDTEPVRAICKGFAVEFIKNYMKSSEFQPVDAFRIESAFERYDANFAGVIMTWTAELAKNECI